MGVFNSPWAAQNGMENFIRFFSNYNFSSTLRNTVVISVYSLAVNIPCSILLAISLNYVRNRFFKKTVQMISYFPYFISYIVIASIPGELHESAELDGCGEFRFLISIVLPLSKAIIAVLVLWIAIVYWNGYFNPMIYLSTKSMYPLQLILREILLMAQVDFTKAASNPEMYYRNKELSEILRYGTIIISSLPLMIVYPFIQKYFVQGVMIGSVKG